MSVQIRKGEAIQIVLHPAMLRSFDEWLKRQGLQRFPIPVDREDLPTFGIESRPIYRSEA